MLEGAKASLPVVVAHEHTAAASGNAGVVVFSTPQLVLLLENACVAAIQEYLEPGQVTLGARLDVAHLAPSPVGSTVTAEAALTSVSGRTLDFEVTAHDEHEEVARGTHRRVVVDRASFLKRAEAKADPSRKAAHASAGEEQ